MKKHLPAAIALTTAAFVIGTTLPAAAATSSIAVPDSIAAVAVDESSHRVYVGTAPTPPPGSDPTQDYNSSGGVAQVDVKTRKLIRSVTLFTLKSSAIGSGVSDVAVSSTSKDLWVLATSVTTGDGCFSTLYQLDKRSLATARTYALGCATKIALDPASRRAYLTEAPLYNDIGDNAQPETPATVVAVDGATGEVRRADVPGPKSAVSSVVEQYIPTSIAFNRKTRQVSVVGLGTAWTYTTGLSLVHTTDLGYPIDDRLSVAANPSTNQVYVSNSRKVTEISGRTHEVTRTSVLSGGSSMVIDPKANRLYQGVNTVKLSTLRAAESEKRAVLAVDPRNHTRYSVMSGRLFLHR